MKHIVILLFMLLARPAFTFGQENSGEINKDHRLLSTFIYRVTLTYNTDTTVKFTHFFALKADMNAQHKITKISFSKSTPAEIRDTLSKLKNLKINWDKIVALKKGVKATVIIPIIDYKRNPPGTIQLASADDLLVNVYQFDDGTRLFSSTQTIPNVWFLPPFSTVRFVEYPPQE